MLYIRAEKLSRQPYRYGGHRPFPANHVFLYMLELKTCLHQFMIYLDCERGFSRHTLDSYRIDCNNFLSRLLLQVFLCHPEIDDPDAYSEDCGSFINYLIKIKKSLRVDKNLPGEKEIESFLSLKRPANSKKAIRLRLNLFLQYLKGLEANSYRVEKKCLTEEVISNFLMVEKLREQKDSSIQRRLGAVRSFLNFLVKEGLLAKSPARHIDTPKKSKPLAIVLNQDKITQLMDAVIEHPSRYPLRDLAMLELLYASGMRSNELRSLKELDVRYDQELILCMGKGSRERIVPVSKRCIKAIKEYCQEERPKLLEKNKAHPGSEELRELLFLSRSGNKLGREVLEHMVTKYAKLATLPEAQHPNFGPHVLRHSLAVHLLAGKANLRIVQEILGHVNVETTELYTHIEKSELKGLHAEFHPRG